MAILSHFEPLGASEMDSEVTSKLTDYEPTLIDVPEYCVFLTAAPHPPFFYIYFAFLNFGHDKVANIWARIRARTRLRAICILSRLRATLNYHLSMYLARLQDFKNDPKQAICQVSQRLTYSHIF